MNAMEQIENVRHFFVLLFWYVGERNWTIQSTSTIVKPRKEPDAYKAGDNVVAKFKGKPYRAVVIRIEDEKEKLNDDKIKFDGYLQDSSLSPQQLLMKMGLATNIETNSCNETVGHMNTPPSKPLSTKKSKPGQLSSPIPKKKPKITTPDTTTAVKAAKAEEKEKREAALESSKLMAARLLQNKANEQTPTTQIPVQKPQTVTSPAVAPLSQVTQPQNTEQTLAFTFATGQAPEPQVQHNYLSTYNASNNYDWNYNFGSNYQNYSASEYFAHSLTSNPEQAPPAPTYDCSKCLPLISALEQRVKYLEERFESRMKPYQSTPTHTTQNTSSHIIAQKPCPEASSPCLETGPATCYVSQPVTQKTIRGRCEGKCDVNVESRSFCKRCRLAKCFTVGMRKDMILDDDQKKMRKQKILINKLRRHGTLPPEDTYAVSEDDMRHSYNQKIVKHSLASLKKQYPSLSAEELSCLQNMKSDESGLSDIKSDPLNSSSEFEPWQEVKDNLSDVLSDMDENDRQILLEMNAAHENSTFLSNTQTKLKSLPTTPTEMFNIADGFVRRIIKVVKQLKMFRNICKDDQIAMLKGSVVEVMVLRSAVNFDVKTETWTLSTKQVIGPSVSGTKPSSTVTSAEAGLTNKEDEKPIQPPGLNIEELRKAARDGADNDTLRNLARQSETGNTQSSNSSFNPPTSYAPDSRMKTIADHDPSVSKPAGLNIEELRRAARSGADINTLRNLAKQNEIGDTLNSGSHFNPSSEFASNLRLQNITDHRPFPSRPGLNIEELRRAARGGVDINTLRNMARQGDSDNKQNYAGTNFNPSSSLAPDVRLDNIYDHNPSMSKPAGLSIEELSKAARMGADINTLRNLAQQGNVDYVKFRQQLNAEVEHSPPPKMSKRSSSSDYEQAINMSKRAHFTSASSDNIDLNVPRRVDYQSTDCGKLGWDDFRSAAHMSAHGGNPNPDSLSGFRSQALSLTSSTSGGNVNHDEIRRASDLNTLGGKTNLNELRSATHRAADLTTHSEKIKPDASPRSVSMTTHGEKLNLDELRNAAMRGADLNTLREMAKGSASLSGQSAMNLENRRRSSEPVGTVPTQQAAPQAAEESENVEQLRNAAKSAGLDIDALRNAAMNDASFEDLSRMARGEHVEIGKQSDGSSSNISAEILKMGNSETRTMFLTYSKFIRSLMKTIHGDLIVLKFMIMLSLFSSDRPGITKPELVEKYQEAYANSFQSYVQRKFPDSKNMFAQCIMKLTDLRNVNEIHTKMLLKMQVHDIEPLLVEIFDLPQ